VFSVVNSVALRPIPAPHGSRIVRIYPVGEDGTPQSLLISAAGVSAGAVIGIARRVSIATSATSATIASIAMGAGTHGDTGNHGNHGNGQSALAASRA
jgi:hypothetical protein